MPPKCTLCHEVSGPLSATSLGQLHHLGVIGDPLGSQHTGPDYVVGLFRLLDVSKASEYLTTGVLIAVEISGRETGQSMAVPSLDPVGIQFDRFGIVAGGLVRLAQSDSSCASIAPIQRRIGLQCDGFRQVDNGFVMPAHRTLGHGPLVPRRRIVRRKRDRLGVAVDRLLPLMQSEINLSRLRPVVGLVGEIGQELLIKRQRLRVSLRCLLVLTA